MTDIKTDRLAAWFNSLPDGGMGKEHFDALLAIVAEPAPATAESGAVAEPAMSTELVERLRRLADKTDRIAHADWCRDPAVPVQGYSGEGRSMREAADELTALTADRDAGRKVYLILQQAANVLAAKNTELTARVALLTEALRPFASEAARYGAYGDGSQRAWLNCTVADLRSARRALSEPDK